MALNRSAPNSRGFSLGVRIELWSAHNMVLRWLTMRGAVALRPIELAKMQNVNL
nr:MAG TPA: hypothetical protein [Caudoviricetes sp.]